MAKTFHLFPRLPTELRTKIWKTAVWDRSVSSANFFTILPAGGAPLATSPRVRLGPPTYDGTVCNCGAPGSSWECTMGSGCMVDSGLWEACHESRAVMKQLYSTTQWFDGETVTGLATDQRGVTRRYTFVPSRDVLVLGLYNFIHAFWNADREIDCVFDVPPATNDSVVSPVAQGNNSRRLRLGDIRHIAVSMDLPWERDGVDFKPEYVEIRRTLIVNLLVAIIEILHVDTIVYLYWSDIGHGGTAEALGTKQAKFYTANGYFHPLVRVCV